VFNTTAAVAEMSNMPQRSRTRLLIMPKGAVAMVSPTTTNVAGVRVDDTVNAVP